MAINVAGTNALGGYLVSEIQNARVLMGESPGYTATPPAPATGSGAPTRSQLQQQLAAAQLSNAETLFGVSPSASTSAAPGALQNLPGQTAQQIASVGIESSLINQEFNNIATLFNSGVGTTMDRSA